MADNIFWHKGICNLSHLANQRNLIICTERAKRDIASLIPLEIINNSQILIKESGYPDLQMLNEMKTIFQSYPTFNNLICVGGGSTLDFGKLLVSEIPNIGILIAVDCLILIPTNIGSGAEITNFATLWDYESTKKYSISLPIKILLETHYSKISMETTTVNNLEIGLIDALAHSFDSLFSRSRNPLSIFLAKKNIEMICNIFENRVLETKNIKNFVNELQLSSLIGGFCIKQTKSSISHAMSYGLTLKLDIPHGQAVGILLQQVLRLMKKDLINFEPDFEFELNRIEIVLNRLNLIQKFPNLESDISDSLNEILSAIDLIRLDNFVFEIPDTKFQKFFSFIY
jgi:alcohol dehydrogenase class IV